MAALIWGDRQGGSHSEGSPTPQAGESVPRILGPLEMEWAEDKRRIELAAAALARPNPHVERESPGSAWAIWTWTVDAPGARAVVLFTNPVFDHRNIASAAFTRLEGSDLWAVTLRLPAALRASYRIAIHRGDDPPPWERASGRRPVTLAVRDASSVDARGAHAIDIGAGGQWSVGAGPDAPPELWRESAQWGRQDGGGSANATEPINLRELGLSSGARSWVYTPPGAREATPLLVLFDGQVWLRLGLPALIEQLIRGGSFPPLHIAFLDSGDSEHRWQHLGVPTGQVDVVLDELLPAIRQGWNVSSRGELTIVSGQSLGGLSALWTLALGGGAVQHAIAQSPSLWRFDVAEALLREPRWRTILMQAGTFEADMLQGARDLHASLHAGARAGRRAEIAAVAGGHDWAVWRAGLIGSLAGLLPQLQAR